jgi:hypothetical protein
MKIAQSKPTCVITNAITLFARPHSAGHRSYVQEKITFAPQHSITHYNAYPYFGVHCSSNKHKLLASRPASQQPYTEWLLRARRCALFADVTGLQPVKRSGKKIHQWESNIRAGYSVDHASIWISSTGSVFLLNEPYQPLLKNPTDLKVAGFTHIEIPLNLSPYCGGGSLDGIAPGTRSYLITSLANHNELVKIEKELHRAALVAPCWNDMSGVSDV